MPPVEKKGTPKAYAPYHIPNQQVQQVQPMDSNPDAEKIIDLMAGLNINETAKPSYDCGHYLDDKQLGRIPFMYQPSEMMKFYNITKLTKESAKTLKMNKIEINEEIHQRYVENSKQAKEAFIKETVTDKVFASELLDIARYFYNNITIYTKKEFEETMQKGFDWTLSRLRSSWDIDKHNKVEGVKGVPQWILLTEQYIATINNVNPVEPVLRFKSSEWVGRMFIHWAKRTTKCTCILESTFKTEMVMNVLTHPTSKRYVLFDDGAYSGSQKAFIISGFISKMIRVRPVTELYVVIPYYTVRAIDQFKDAVYVYTNAFSDDLTCELEMQPDCHRYTVQTHDKSHTLHIYIWMGGKEMATTTEIIDMYPVADSAKKQALTSALTLGGGIGATLSTFEHKVPDALSLNLRFGYYFSHTNDAMRNHYKHNPPYKVNVK